VRFPENWRWGFIMRSIAVVETRMIALVTPEGREAAHASTPDLERRRAALRAQLEQFAGHAGSLEAYLAYRTDLTVDDVRRLGGARS
jgi:hypothetical protein